MSGASSADPTSTVSAPEIPADVEATWPSLRPVNAQPGLRLYLEEMWARRSFMVVVPAGDLKARHQDTMLGQLWHMFNPLLLTAVYFLIFDVIVNRSLINEDATYGYLAFLVAGIIPYQYTQKTVMQGARLIISNRSLIQSVRFPRAVLPVSAVIGELMAHGTALFVMLAVILATGVRPSIAWLLVIPITFFQSIFNLGLSFLASRLTFHFRDFQNILPFALRLWFYISGILFEIEQFTQDHPTRRLLLEANPINAFIRLIRDATLEGRTELSAWILALGWTGGLLVAGFFYFRAAETEYGRV
ncbi:MAG: ABC transporter permease [Nitriliruptorales bacterium]|nr:ABC transporter permease [Nitriliruptorales bacterium]